MISLGCELIINKRGQFEVSKRLSLTDRLKWELEPLGHNLQSAMEVCQPSFHQKCLAPTATPTHTPRFTTFELVVAINRLNHNHFLRSKFKNMLITLPIRLWGTSMQKQYLQLACVTCEGRTNNNLVDHDFKKTVWPPRFFLWEIYSYM